MGLGAFNMSLEAFNVSLGAFNVGLGAFNASLVVRMKACVQYSKSVCDNFIIHFEGRLHFIMDFFQHASFNPYSVSSHCKITEAPLQMNHKIFHRLFS